MPNIILSWDIQKAVDFAVRKHPCWPSDPIHAASVVAEEAGELLKAANEFVYEKGSPKAMYIEACHTAAVCIRFLDNFKAMYGIKEPSESP